MRRKVWNNECPAFPAGSGLFLIHLTALHCSYNIWKFFPHCLLFFSFALFLKYWCCSLCNLGLYFALCCLLMFWIYLLLTPFFPVIICTIITCWGKLTPLITLRKARSKSRKAQKNWMYTLLDRLLTPPISPFLYSCYTWFSRMLEPQRKAQWPSVKFSEKICGKIVTYSLVAALCHAKANI